MNQSLGNRRSWRRLELALLFTLAISWIWADRAGAQTERGATADTAAKASPASAEATTSPKPGISPEEAKEEEQRAKAEAVRRAAAEAQKKRLQAQGSRVNKLEPNPNAKFACDELTVTAPPVWRSPTGSVDFEFSIRNEGTADLQIRAKGG